MISYRDEYACEDAELIELITEISMVDRMPITPEKFEFLKELKTTVVELDLGPLQVLAHRP